MTRREVEQIKKAIWWLVTDEVAGGDFHQGMMILHDIISTDKKRKKAKRKGPAGV